MPAPINPVRGTAHPNSRLTEADIDLIRRCVAERERMRREANKLSNQQLAEKFGVHQRTIDRITQNRGWIHVSPTNGRIRT